jgi:uncharacterized membrane protein
MFWLTIWVIIGTIVRLINLSGKPPWIDEFATIVFSLGNSFKSVPLDRIIDFSELIAPLIPNPDSTVGDTIRLMFSEDQHPPLYFVINHLWFKLFPPHLGLVDLWAARLLSVFFGIIAIPIIYCSTFLLFKSNSIAQSTAAIMALSPYGVYISQEARHYSLAVILVIISLACLCYSCQLINQNRKLSIDLVLGWLVINNLGMGVHYFFALVILAEFIALILFFLWHGWRNHSNYFEYIIHFFNQNKSTINQHLNSYRLLMWGGEHTRCNSLVKSFSRFCNSGSDRLVEDTII